MNNRIEKVMEETKPKRKIFKNAFQAFIIGGLFSFFAQLIIEILKMIGLEKEISNNLGVTIMVFLGALLTGLGLYDKIGQYGGAGTIVPITGFANSMASSALEYKSEGLVLGILTNMFKLAGSVIAAGVVSAFIVGSIIYLFRGIL
mgnify:CR=1 FL=1